jgi:ABC-type lipoprotein export system ATPase subunit
MTPTPVARLRHVARCYGRSQGAVVAVHDVTVELCAGEQVALTGPSGSGKSTLLHLIAGLETPTAGTVDWPAIGPASRLRPGRVAVVFQGPSLIPALDVEENVTLPLLLEGADRRAAGERALACLRQLGLEGLAGKLPEELSGGQAQRVAVARALAGDASLILADEPTGQLDRANGALVVDALRAAASQNDAALVVSTHDEGIAAQFPHRWSLTGGRLTRDAVGG